MYCEQCGKFNEEGTNYCSSCGSPLIKMQTGDGKESKITEDPPVEKKHEEATSEELKALERELHQLNRSSRPRIAFSAAVLVLIAVVILLAVQVPKRYGPEQDARGFEIAMLSGNWSEAYGYLFFEEEPSTYLSAEMFETVRERTGADGFRSLSLEEISSTADKKIYSAVYETSEGTKNNTITMVRTGNKKLLFLNEWKVDLSTVSASGISIAVPSEADILLNGLSPESEGVENLQEQSTVYTFDRLFTGVWTAELNAENRAAYYTDVEIAAEDNAFVSLAGAELYPDQELMDAILAQFVSDYQAILENSVNRQDFSAVEQYFAEAAIAEGRAQNMYANACSQAYDPETGSGILRYELSDITASFVSTVRSGYAEPGDLVMEIQSVMTYSYLDEGMEKSDTQTSVGLLCYHQENGQWKIQSFS